MTEQTAPTTGTENTNTPETESGKPKEFQAITSQEDFEARLKDRLARERAKFENYDSYKAKAEQFDQFEASQKTEAQKQADRLDALATENAALKLAQLRAQVAEAKSDPAKGIVVPAALLSGSTQAELEASADALIAFRGEQKPPRLHVPGEGRTPNQKPSDESEFVKDLFGAGD